MKLFLISGAIAGLCVLGGCGGGNDEVRQFPQNADMWTALGGDAAAPAAISKVVDDAVAGLLADPKEAPYFAVVGQPGHDSVGRLKACLRLQFGALFGGPYQYPGPVSADGGTVMCDDMVAAHADLGIPGCVFDGFITDAAAVLKQDGVPDAYIARVAPVLVGLKGDIVSKTPQYLGPNTAQGCQ
jgi:hypothetical protein